MKQNIWNMRFKAALRSLLPLCLFTLLPVSASAQDAAYNIISEKDTTISFMVNGINLGSRDIHRYLYAFPSVDADGQPVNISGAVWVPSNIYDGSAPCDGVVLYNHYTHLSAAERISVLGEEFCNGLLASPLKPNYVFVISDYLGFGISANRPQAYLCGETNARNSLDGLLAARQLMDDKGIPQGKYLFNMGYSQGGTESMFAAKLRDMEYKDKGITFDKTFSGGGPLDFDKVYTELVKIGYNHIPAAVVLMMVSMNENYHMGLDYKDMFQEPLASHINEWILSKNYNEAAVRKLIGNDTLKNYLQPAYVNLESDAAKALRQKLQAITLTNGWEPDPEQHYFIEHSRHDDYVPIQSSRSIFSWMRDKGFTTSIVPGKTNLQTNTAVFKLGHETASVVWLIQTAAAIQLWPVLYYEGEQNRYYHDVVKDLNLLKAIKLLESLGVDLRKVITSDKKRNGAVNENNILVFLTELAKKLEPLGLDLPALWEMFGDSGIGLMDLVAAYNYLTSDSAEAASRDAGGRVLDGESVESERYSNTAPFYLLRKYEQTLAAWLLTGGVDVQYESWGW